MNFADITSITSECQSLSLQQQRSAELGKHKILLAAIMRVAAGTIPGDYERALVAPYRVLSDVEAHAPEVVTDLLASPQFGAWADDVLRRLLDEVPAPAAAPLPTDLGHLAAFAVTAAVRAGRPFSLEVPLRDGLAAFPTLGSARLGAGARWEWGHAWRDGTGWRLRSSVATVAVPGDASWSSLPRFSSDERGLRLDVVLDDKDPFLDRYGNPRTQVAAADLPAWREVVARAWVLLAANHYALAALISGTVRTLVPLTLPHQARPTSSTEMGAFGAVALSRPADALSMAEVLVHEACHALLGARMDLEPLVRDDPAAMGFLAYAPWRDDPRPAAALLQGIFAHYGMGQFWRERYHARAGPSRHQLRAAAEFGRIRSMLATATAPVARAGVLTEAGREFLEGIQGELTAWLAEPLPARVREHVTDLDTDHEVRWRLSHLAPDPGAIAALAGAWRRGASPPVPLDAIATRLVPGPLAPASASMRSYLLSLRYKDPDRLRRPLSDGSWPADAADAALVRGEYDAAAAGYLRRIAAGEDHDAWAGLATVARHTASASVARLLASRPEVLAALHGLVQGNPDDLARWLTR